MENTEELIKGQIQSQFENITKKDQIEDLIKIIKEGNFQRIDFGKNITDNMKSFNERLLKEVGQEKFDKIQKMTKVNNVKK